MCTMYVHGGGVVLRVTGRQEVGVKGPAGDISSWLLCEGHEARAMDGAALGPSQHGSERGYIYSLSGAGTYM